MSDLNTSLGKRVKSLRQSRSLSQEQLAERAGISTKYLGEVERGIGNISIKHLTGLADALGVSVTDIMEHRHERPHQELVAEIIRLAPLLTKKDTQIVYRMVKMLTE